VTPPLTWPLDRSRIGYGVVNTNYTHLLDAPFSGASTLGFLRQGAVVEVLERRRVRAEAAAAGTGAAAWETWALVRGTGQQNTAEGWLPEAAMRLYDRLERAENVAKEALP